MGATTASEQLKTANAWQALERKFWSDHWEEYIATYGPGFIAVRNGEVILSDAELCSFSDRLEEMGIIPSKDVWVEYVSHDSETWIL
jgi:hypothetical protein